MISILNINEECNDKIKMNEDILNNLLFIKKT